MRSTYLSSYNCNFCSRSFKKKLLLQSHLFHVHNELICFNDTVKREISKSKIFNVNTSPEDDILRTSTNKNSLCSNNLVQSEKIDTLINVNKSRNDDVINIEKSRTEKLFNNEVSPTKRLRQPTLTEYLELCKKKRNIKFSPNKLNITKDDFPTCALRHDDQIEKLPEEQNGQIDPLSTQSDNLLKRTVRSIQKQNMKHEMHKKPFVKLHADVEMMKSFLEKLSDTVVEDKITEDGTSNIISYDRGIPYSLRSLNGVSSGEASSNLGMRENKSVSKKSRFGTEFNIKNKGNGIDLEKITSKVDWKIIMTHFKCKECTIFLTRCDEQPRNSYQISAFKAKKNTCLTPGYNCQESDVRNEVKLKDVEVSLERLTVVPTVHIKEKTPDVEKHNNNYFLCKVCKESFSSKLAKRIHIKSSHIAYMSSICGARYKLKHKLLQHYLREHVSKQNQCCICYMLLSDYEALKQHLNVHCLKYIQRQDDQYLIDTELECNLTKKSKYLRDETFLSRTSLKEHQNHCIVQKEIEEDQKDSMEETNSSPKDIPEVQHEKTDDIVDITCHENINLDDLCNPLNSDCVKKSNEHQTSLHNKKEQEINEADQNILVNNNLIKEEIGTINESQHPKKLLENNSTINNQDVANTQLNNIATKNGTYPCDICGKQFQTPKNLEIHVRNFSFTSDVCPLCGTGFSSKRFLQSHITAAHVPHISKTYNFHCVFCNQGFFKKHDLRSHILHLHDQQVLNTLTCNPNNQEKSNESITHSTVCNVCNLVFETHDRYVEHRMYYYKNHTFRCSLCEQNFQGMYMFHHHNKLTHCPEDKRKSYNHICEVCHEGFNHESHFYSHNIHVHSNEVNLGETTKESEDTKNRSRNSSNVQKQIRNCSMDQEKQNEQSNEYICQICQLKCKNMVMHKEFYSNDGDFKCDKCNRRCKTFDFLNQHKKLTHSCRDVYNGHICHICGEALETEVGNNASIFLSTGSIFKTGSIIINKSKTVPAYLLPTRSLSTFKRIMPKPWKSNEITNQKSESVNSYTTGHGYSCPLCPLEYPSLLFFHAHLKYAHADSIVSIRTDELTVPQVNKSQKVSMIECLLCPCTFPDETKYKKHLRNSHTYYVYIPNSQEMTKINNMRNPLTQTNVNKKSTVLETITIDDDDDNVKNTSNQGVVEVTALNYKEQNEKIGKLRVKPLAKIIENLSMDSASKLL
ncbi:ZKSC5 protein, partial [Acromyrmex insinuator]